MPEWGFTLRIPLSRISCITCGQGQLARGLAAFLNGTLVDAYFRQFNGHTQVNATDLRSMSYPTLEQLRRLGGRIGNEFPGQTELDDLIDQEVFAMVADAKGG